MLLRALKMKHKIAIGILLVIVNSLMMITNFVDRSSAGTSIMQEPDKFQICVNGGCLPGALPCDVKVKVEFPGGVVGEVTYHCGLLFIVI